MYRALIDEGDKSILSMKWCNAEIKYPCLFNLIKSFVEAGHYLKTTHGESRENWQWNKVHTSFYGHVPFG